MNILFLTLLDFDSIQEHNIYTDLLREFIKHGHKIYAVSPIERKKKKKTYLLEEENISILKLKIGNMQKTNSIEKGISMISAEWIFIYGIKKFFSHVIFDAIMYSTPPITFCNAIQYIKKRNGSITYLLLKDIFPQNAVDIGLMNKKGIRSVLYRYFRKKEKKLYQISDYIGCMSQANVEYILKHNPEIEQERVEVCPNSIEVIDKSLNRDTRIKIRKKYKIPLDKRVLVYGGNLGKPQGIDFLIRCLQSQSENLNIYFLIVGDGTEYDKIETFLFKSSQSNVKLLRTLPKEDYDSLVGACDVGMIFLDYRFTIPNFPSRLLSYMQAKIPILACTDPNTDIGKVIEEEGFGWWCQSNNIEKFNKCINNILGLEKDKLNSMIAKEYHYLVEKFSVKECYETIINRIKVN